MHRLQQTVPISVCFHYRNQTTLWRQMTHPLQIVSQSAAINDSRSRFHFKSFA
jgi:hypothetical protein